MPSAAVRDKGALQMRPAPCGYSSALRAGNARLYVFYRPSVLNVGATIGRPQRPPLPRGGWPSVARTGGENSPLIACGDLPPLCRGGLSAAAGLRADRGVRHYKRCGINWKSGQGIGPCNTKTQPSSVDGCVLIWDVIRPSVCRKSSCAWAARPRRWRPRACGAAPSALWSASSASRRRR